MRRSGQALTVVLCCISGALTMSACASAASDEAPAATASAAPMTCMPKPSACGFPDATNTGVIPGTPLTPASGIVTLGQAGQVYENRELRGSIVVTAPNVTIRNVRLINTDPYYAIGIRNGQDWDNDQANLLLDHVEIDLNSHPNIKGVAFNGFTARHVFFHNGADCSHFGENVVIEDSLCALGPDTNGDGIPDDSRDVFCKGEDHFDGFQSDGGRNITLRHNTIRNPCGQTAAILMSTNTSPIDSVVIDHNLMSGGGYTVYCGTSSGGVATNLTYTNNVISKEYFPRGGYWGPSTECEKAKTAGGNIWDGNYVPATPPSSPGEPGAGSGPGTGTPSGGGAAARRLLRSRARLVTRGALAREFGRRYTKRSKGPQIGCRRKSAVVMACHVAWTGPRSTPRRYRGVVKVRRLASTRWRYALRVRAGNGKAVKRAGQIRRKRAT